MSPVKCPKSTKYNISLTCFKIFLDKKTKVATNQNSSWHWIGVWLLVIWQVMITIRDWKRTYVRARFSLPIPVTNGIPVVIYSANAGLIAMKFLLQNSTTFPWPYKKIPWPLPWPFPILVKIPWLFQKFNDFSVTVATLQWLWSGFDEIYVRPICLWEWTFWGVRGFRHGLVALPLIIWGTVVKIPKNK